MKSKLQDCLDADIPILKGKKGVKRWLLFFKAIRWYPSYHAVFLLRFCHVYHNAKGVLKYMRTHYKRILNNRYGIFCNIGPDCVIGKGLSLPHPVSIVLGEGVNIGERCTIYQNVTLGAKKKGNGKLTEEKEQYPQIGDDCVFYAGAVAIGGIHIANGTQVGANAVLVTDTQESSVYAGVPATRKR